MRRTFVTLSAAVVVAGVWTASALAAEPAVNVKTPVAGTATTAAPMHHFRASTLEGMPVRNAAGDDLGKVKDFVIDMQSGKVVYATLDFGGFLGIGDKYFAIPWSSLKYSHDKDRHLVLNLSKEDLKNAPGFDKNHWPDFGDPKWSGDVDTYYREHTKTAAR